MPQDGETKSWLITRHGDRILLHGICSIGRAESNNLIISKGSVSRHHAVIHERDKEYWVVDLGGVNGVLLNGNRVVQSAKLQSGDIIGIPTTDFIFQQETVAAEAPAPIPAPVIPPLETAPTKESVPAAPKVEVPPKRTPVKDAAPVVPEANPPLEGPMEAVAKPAPVQPPVEIATPTAVTIPLPLPRKPTQQDELALGLPQPSPTKTSDLKKARVYVGPVDTQGMPKGTASQPLRPEAFKLSETGAAKPFTVSLPKPSSDDILKITTPLAPVPWVEKPKEIPQVNASDVIVTPVEKPKTPPVLPKPAEAKVEADSFLQPSTSQEAASSTKSVTLLQKPKEAIPLSSIPATTPDVAKTSQRLEKKPPPLAKIVASDKSDGADAEGLLLAPPLAKAPTPNPAVPLLLLRDKPDEAKKTAPVEKTPDVPVTKAPPPLAPTKVNKQAKEDLIFTPSIAKAPTPAPTVSQLLLLDKPAEAKLPPPIEKAPEPPVSAKPSEPKKPLQKTPAPVQKAPATAAPKVVLSSGAPVVPSDGPQGALCLSALHSMYIGLASIFLPFLGLFTAPVAIVLGHSALKQIKQSRGALAGRQSAVLGLYFGYISLVLISSYTILLYLLFFSHPATPSIVLSTPTFTSTTPPPPMTVSPAPKSGSTSSLPTLAPSLDTAPPSRIAPNVDASTPTPTPTPTPLPAANTPQTVISDSTGGNATTLLQNNSPDTNTAPATPSAPAVVSVPSAPTPTAAVYDPAILGRLKDGMLQQPMPEDSSSPAYLDAEAFNNCARLLARPPDPKYAESVGDFLEDVKKRNPDPARLQILSAMYDNYMAGIKRDF